MLNGSPTPSRLVSPEFATLMLASVLFFGGFGILNALVPTFVVDELDGSEATAGAPDTKIELAHTDYRTYTGTRWNEPKWFPPWQLREDHPLVLAKPKSITAPIGALQPMWWPLAA